MGTPDLPRPTSRILFESVSARPSFAISCTPQVRCTPGSSTNGRCAGVTLLRNRLGADAITVLILSAGYGLIEEEQLVAPYDVTFSQMGKREARHWRAPDAARSLRARMGDYELVLVLLGSAYLGAVDPPLPIAPRQRSCALRRRRRRRVSRPAGVCSFRRALRRAPDTAAASSASRARCSGFSAQPSTVKGRA